MSQSQSFEQWLKRPVYVAQCKTFALATRLTPHCHKIRYLTRTVKTQEARNAVAKAARAFHSSGQPFPEANPFSFAVPIDMVAELAELQLVAA